MAATVFQPKSEDLSDLSKFGEGREDELEELVKNIPLPPNNTEEPSIERIDILDYKDEAFLLTNVLTGSQCQHYMRCGDELGFQEIVEASKKYRNSSRIMMQSEDLANLLWKRILPQLEDVHIDDDPHKVHIHGISSIIKGTWKPCRLNNIFRLCSYKPGGHFAPHFDGHLVKSSRMRSMKTLMLYLNDDFEFGSTNFIDERQSLYMDAEGKYCAEEDNILYRIMPKPGLAVIFNHHRLHEGEAVRNGVKYILRTDIMYEKVGEYDIDPKEEEALNIVQQAERLEGAGQEMEAMELYRKAFKMSPSLAEAYGN